MRPRLGWWWLGLLLVLGAAPACTAGPRPVVLGPDDYGAHLTLRPGQKVEVHLPANPTTGYTWTLAEADPAVLAAAAEPQYTPEAADRPGSGGVEVWTFEAQAPGTTVVRLIYHRPWEQDTPPAAIFQVTVTVR